MAIVRLSLDPPLRAAVARIRRAGYAVSDEEAIRVAVADMGTRLAPLVGNVDFERIEQEVSIDALEAAKIALDIMKRVRCVCREDTGRHHVTHALLTDLIELGQSPWVETLRHGYEYAVAFNRRVGLPPDVAPAGVRFTPGAMSQNWLRDYLGRGAGRFRERYSKDGPVVPTRAAKSPAGVVIALA